MMENGDVLKLTPDHAYQFESSSSQQNSVEHKSSLEVCQTNERSTLWRVCGQEDALLIYGVPRFDSESEMQKIASFDLDGTLIKTKSGKKFPIDQNDWTAMFGQQTIKSKLENLIQTGHKIVVFSNQKGVGTGKLAVDCFMEKVERVVKFFDFPMTCYVALKDGLYRKPMTGMWNEMISSMPRSASVNMENCFYVGDAAGRTEVKGRRQKDHSCADRLFALNIGIKFLTPEEFFLGSTKKEPFEMPSFDPTLLVNCRKPLLEPETASLTSSEQEMIILTGYPASGKSTFAHKNFSAGNYQIINQDTLKSARKCLKLVESALKEGKSVVIDNTNPNAESRSKYIDLVKSKFPQCRLRCFLLNASFEQAKHNNKFRQLTAVDDRQHKNVEDIVLYTYRKKFQEPSENEGFAEIVCVNFEPDFVNLEQKRLYTMHLLEK